MNDSQVIGVDVGVTSLVIYALGRNEHYIFLRCRGNLKLHGGSGSHLLIILH